MAYATKSIEFLYVPSCYCLQSFLSVKIIIGWVIQLFKRYPIAEYGSLGVRMC